VVDCSALVRALTDHGPTGHRFADHHLGQRVGGQSDIHQVTGANLVDEGVSWGLRRQSAARVVTETLDLVADATSDVSGDDRVLALFANRPSGYSED
jgi:hypothetical protein